MANVTLNASIRAETGKGVARKLRQAGSIPAVIYGRDREPQSLSVNARETEKLLKSIAVSSTVIELSVDGQVAHTLIREVQRHPFKRNVLHIDFQQIVAGEVVAVKCPILYVGTPEGVRLEGGILDQIMHELHIEVDPTAIPNHISVDISDVKLGRPLHVSDIKLPAGVKVLDDPAATVCVVAAPRVQQEAQSTEESSAEPELIRKPKPEDAN